MNPGEQWHMGNSGLSLPLLETQNSHEMPQKKSRPWRMGLEVILLVKPAQETTPSALMLVEVLVSWWNGLWEGKGIFSLEGLSLWRGKDWGYLCGAESSEQLGWPWGHLWAGGMCKTSGQVWGKWYLPSKMELTPCSAETGTELFPFPKAEVFPLCFFFSAGENMENFSV